MLYATTPYNQVIQVIIDIPIFIITINNFVDYGLKIIITLYFYG